jgi:chloramphenicol O-acetyltransferase type B
MEWATTSPLRTLYGLPGAADDSTTAGDVAIGNDVWVASEAMISSGVRIGDGAVVAARAVVTRDVRPYALVGGVPAREIRRRFDDATVEALLELRWWDWPDAKIIENVALLCGFEGSVDELLRQHLPGHRTAEAVIGSSTDAQATRIIDLNRATETQQSPQGGSGA